MSIAPVTFSWQAAACGNTAASRSSDSIRWIGGGLRRPPRNRSTISDRLRFQRQRAWNIGESRMACSRVSRTVRLERYRGTSSRGKLWWGPSDSTTASSVAAACSSKLNVRQNFLRSARPSARLIRPPKGEWITSCMPPVSSKKRSNDQALLGGHGPERGAARPPGSRRS